MAVSIPLLHHLLKPHPPSFLFLEPLCLTSSLHLHKPLRSFIINPNSHSSSSSVSYFLKPSSSYLSSSSFSHPQTLSTRALVNQDREFDLDTENEFEEEFLTEDEGVETEEVEEEITGEAQIEQELEPLTEFEVPVLTMKEKKELASYAHSLGKKLKSQQVGKSGVTSSQAAAFIENLESNELLKLKIHNSCPGELVDVVRALEKSTGSVAVGQIGRSVILYRPSITKLKAAEKRNQERKVYVRKGYTPRPTDTLLKKVEVPRFSGSGRRGRRVQTHPTRTRS
ncbi:hypothetical protein C5167_037677 [Papaver somniferum]|uniref:CRM domain-containing protein n=1 Tax=Papaver somniferum TaxID=3469 RepID=A0A4Y7IA93_PAPSO|nr:uncharacterized protein LOC113289418 [Papaver somniferum]RZC44730.1 hypothetical protein C5167_037677 [Papaver somniferum]